MAFKVLRKGRGPVYGHLKAKVVATGLTWQEAHEMCISLNNMWGGSWDIWMTND